MTGSQAWNPPGSNRTIQLGLSGDQTASYCLKMRKITSTHYNQGLSDIPIVPLGSCATGGWVSEMVWLD